MKLNQRSLHEDIDLYFQSHPRDVDYSCTGSGEHGRIEVRQISTTTELNGYLDFPHIGQVFKIRRGVTSKKTGKCSDETIYGITSKTAQQSSPSQILQDNRTHWTIESCHWIIDWNYDEDRSQIRSGYGPENITRLRRFAIGVLKSKSLDKTIPEMMKNLMWNRRAVFDYLKMTKNSNTKGACPDLA